MTFIFSGVEAAKLQAQGWIYDSSQWKAHAQRSQSRATLMHLKTPKKSKNNDRHSSCTESLRKVANIDQSMVLNQRSQVTADYINLSSSSPALDAFASSHCPHVLCEQMSKSIAYEHLYF
ncbi:unnamed protein product [Soboliphyme baturini]|uniref:NDC10_II domain-containing protein n=1 Tax=Soboliphyme baturini TaxID=241478 RepID=A0A183I9Q5_9BILA|nr:unnamed protein product [Soboliphyme baturini]